MLLLVIFVFLLVRLKSAWEFAFGLDLWRCELPAEALAGPLAAAGRCAGPLYGASPLLPIWYCCMLALRLPPPAIFASLLWLSCDFG